MGSSKGFNKIEHIYRDEQKNLHRDGGPAIIYRDGTQIWYQHGQRHREDGPAYFNPIGMTIWYRHGQKHREDGPAVNNPDNSNEWWFEGELHRLGGPAVHNTRNSGQKYQWWAHGRLCETTEDYCQKTGMTRDRLMWMLLRYGEVESWREKK